MSAGRKLSAAADIIRDYGWGTFLFRAAPWLVSRRYHVHAGPLSRPVDGGPAREGEFRMEIVRGGDIKEVVGLRPWYYTPRIVAERLEEGHVCFLGWSGGKPVHVRWIFNKSVFLPYLGRSIALGPGEAYSDESFTRPEFRRRGLTHQAFQILMRRLPGLGYRRLIALVVPWNEATRKILETNGIRRVGTCGYEWKGCSRSFFASGSVCEEAGRAIRLLED